MVLSLKLKPESSITVLSTSLGIIFKNVLDWYLKKKNVLFWDKNPDRGHMPYRKVVLADFFPSTGKRLK